MSKKQRQKQRQTQEALRLQESTSEKPKLVIIKKPDEPLKYGKLIYNISYAYLMLPFFLFIFSWLKFTYALPLAVALGYAYKKMTENAPEMDIKSFILKHKIEFGISLVFILIWTAYSGVGGYVYQNSDYGTRNAMFNILATQPWPIVDYNPEMYDYPVVFSYYFLMWLPAALVGKVFGWVSAKIFLGIWVAFGITLAFILLSNKIAKKPSLWIILIFIIFSGFDVLGQEVLNVLGQFDYQKPIDLVSFPQFVFGLYDSQKLLKLNGFPHIEWTVGAGLWQFSSNTTQLFWVFNHAIPAWLGTMLILDQKSNRAIGLILSLIVLLSTFAAFGLLIIALYKMITNTKATGIREYFTLSNIKALLKDSITYENLLCLVIVAISYLFLSVSQGMQEGVDFERWGDWNRTRLWLWFLTLDVFIWFAVLLPKNWKKPLFYVALLSLVGLSRVRSGIWNDFCMRTTIPALFILMIYVMATLKDYWETVIATFKARAEERFLHRLFNLKIIYNSFMVILLVAMLGLGSVTPAMEIGRAVRGTRDAYRDKRNPEYPYGYLFNNHDRENFTGKLDSTFFNTIGKVPKDGGNAVE